jgi:ribosome-associated heat shock protein Hsp15
MCAARPPSPATCEETEVSVARRAAVAENRRLFREPTAGFKGRPTKRDRRQQGKVGESQ